MLKELKIMAEDESISMRDAAKLLGISKSRVARLSTKNGLNWVTRPRGGQRRIPDFDQKSFIIEAAKDYAVTMGEVCKKLGMGRNTLNRLLKEYSVEWKYGVTTGRMDEIRALAADPGVSLPVAAKKVGMSVRGLRGVLIRYGIEWVRAPGGFEAGTRPPRPKKPRPLAAPLPAKDVPPHRPTLPHTTKAKAKAPIKTVTRPRPSPLPSQQILYSNNTTRISKTPPAVDDLPLYSMTPNAERGGWDWVCEQLNAKGWKPGRKDEAQKAIEYDLAWAKSRRGKSQFVKKTYNPVHLQGLQV